MYTGLSIDLNDSVSSYCKFNSFIYFFTAKCKKKFPYKTLTNLNSTTSSANRYHFVARSMRDSYKVDAFS